MNGSGDRVVVLRQALDVKERIMRSFIEPIDRQRETGLRTHYWAAEEAAARRELRLIERDRKLLELAEQTLRAFEDPAGGLWPDVTRRERSHADSLINDLCSFWLGEEPER